MALCGSFVQGQVDSLARLLSRFCRHRYRVRGRCAHLRQNPVEALDRSVAAIIMPRKPMLRLVVTERDDIELCRLRR